MRSITRAGWQSKRGRPARCRAWVRVRAATFARRNLNSSALRRRERSTHSIPTSKRGDATKGSQGSSRAGRGLARYVRSNGIGAWFALRACFAAASIPGVSARGRDFARAARSQSASGCPVSPPRQAKAPESRSVKWKERPTPPVSLSCRSSGCRQHHPKQHFQTSLPSALQPTSRCHPGRSEAPSPEFRHLAVAAIRVRSRHPPVRSRRR